MNDIYPTVFYRALRALLMGDTVAALAAARRVYKVHTNSQNEIDCIWDEWLLGTVLVTLSCKKKPQQNKFLTEAETHLTAALTRCRRINLVELEPDILLAWARWHQASGHTEQARQSAQEALSIADRCEYRLKQADIQNFLARLALEGGDREVAKAHATTAYRRAWCDGPPHCYKPALDEAAGMLRELGVEPPRL
jgi:tetratricopeptide (TPR) repeat protein